MSGKEPLVAARALRKRFRQSGSLLQRKPEIVHAVDGVDLDVFPGEVVGLVGESGSGKSTLGRMLVRLTDPDSGSLSFDGVDLLELKGKGLRQMRRQFQIVFQDPYGSLNPRMRVGTAIGEPLVVHKLTKSKEETEAKVVALLERVGLDARSYRKYPHEFSGGQRQRIGIARAIACSPRFIVADEPVSALDASVQAQIVNLLLDLQEQLGLAYLFIAHDLRLVQRICDRVAVMYLGKIVEEAPAERLAREPRHPYTKALFDSVPTLEPGAPEAPSLQGEPPSPTAPPSGCPFHPRCPEALTHCAETPPQVVQIGESHRVACHLIDGETARSETNRQSDA